MIIPFSMLFELERGVTKVNDIKSINLKFMYAKKYKDQFIINKSITNLLYKMTKEEYKIYLHEKMLKERI